MTYDQKSIVPDKKSEIRGDAREFLIKSHRNLQKIHEEDEKREDFAIKHSIIKSEDRERS